MFGKAYDLATLTITAVHSIVTDKIWHYEAEYYRVYWTESTTSWDSNSGRLKQNHAMKSCPWGIEMLKWRSWWNINSDTSLFIGLWVIKSATAVTNIMAEESEHVCGGPLNPYSVVYTILNEILV